ncbi:DUF2062 domain-containing protein [Desulfonatronum thiodismutans]|uniref:DUF2062 domain-containing protein n=1 Tax=Desulfonatronum thiodismutans TaxID=159290 RepID=UPI00068A4713|nr:DUF2062 domain-containing protein [Desulfonatronum thiodismutans]
MTAFTTSFPHRILKRIRKPDVSQRLQDWLTRHPRSARLLHHSGALRTDPDALARGVAVGLFIGLTPTFGVQTALIVVGCILLRGNVCSALAASWVCNPLTIIPLYWCFHALGDACFSTLPAFAAPPFAPDAWDVGDELLITALGSLIMAFPLAVFGYLAALQGAGRLLRQRAMNRSLKNGV